MAAASDEFKVLNPYQIFIGKIIQEIHNREVKVWKAVLLDKVPFQELEKINVDGEYASAEIFSTLRKYRLISRNNLELLKDLLKLTHNYALLSKVEYFEKSVKVVEDARVDQITMISQDAAFVELYLVISCKKENLSPTKITELKDAIVKVTDLHEKRASLDCKRLDIFYQYSSENESDTDTTVVVFHFPKDNEEFIIDQIHKLALSKDKLLVDNGVIQLKVNGKSSINLKESLEFKAKDVEDDFFLARKPELQPPAKNVVDIVLVVEMPHSVTPHACKEVIKICHSAFQDITATSELDINLSIIQYGNQTDSTSDHVHVLQDFSKEFDVKSKLKEIGQCGSKGEGNSGMADALAKVAELAQSSPSARSNASKVCILVTFPSKSEKGLEHYRSCHGNDIFKTTNLLAEYGMPVYIFGAQDKKPDLSDPRCLHVREELFLSGVAHIGGGRYFGISAFGSKLLNDVVRHNVSIENHEEKLGEVVRNAIKNNFGDTNENIIAGDVVRDPQFTPSMFVPLLQNGRSLELVKQAAKRIALSDDLDDAIKALARIEKKEQEAKSSITRGAPIMAQGLFTARDEFHCSGPCIASEAKATTTMKNIKKQQNAKVDVENLPKELQEEVVLDDGNHTPDLEMATRIVRRHFYRMAYCKKK